MTERAPPGNQPRYSRRTDAEPEYTLTSTSDRRASWNRTRVRSRAPASPATDEIVVGASRSAVGSGCADAFAGAPSTTASVVAKINPACSSRDEDGRFVDASCVGMARTSETLESHLRVSPTLCSDCVATAGNSTYGRAKEGSSSAVASPSGFHQALRSLEAGDGVLDPHEQQVLAEAARISERGHPAGLEDLAILHRSAAIHRTAQQRLAMRPDPLHHHAAPNARFGDVPSDHAGLVQYLRELETSRQQELRMLQQLRARLEHSASWDTPGPRWAAFVAMPGLRLACTAAVIALVITAAALAPSLLRGSGEARSATPLALGGGAAPAAVPADGHTGHDHGTPTPTAGQHAVGTGLGVELGEFFVKPTRASTSAGLTTFVIRNGGDAEHEFMVIRSGDIRRSIPTMNSTRLHEAAVASVHGLRAGARKELKVKLAPGRYVLFCNLPGHYAAGQHTTLQVA